MKFIKLGIISLIAFGALLWGFTLLFPSNTVISRAINIAGNTDSLRKRVMNNEVSLQTVLAGNQSGLVVKDADIPFYTDNLFNALSAGTLPEADTIFFQVSQHNKVIAQGGVAFYQLQQDSATTQMFYVFQTPWYKPLTKMKMVVADKVYGPGLDSALIRLKNLMYLPG